MNNKVYNFELNIDWKLINLISEIDRFDANWTAIERKEGQSLNELKALPRCEVSALQTELKATK